MITIKTTTREEYDKMMKYAMEYVCRQINFVECGLKGYGHCDDCFSDNHKRCGIKVKFSPIDKTDDKHL